MPEYDTALKNVLQRLSAAMLAEVTGFAVTRWLNVELPEVRSLRADLLGETAEGQLGSRRTAEHQRSRHRLPHGRVWAGHPAAVRKDAGSGSPVCRGRPSKMKMTAQGPHMTYSCRLIDIRCLDAEPWLASDRIEDNILAILLRLGNEVTAVRPILHSIAACPRQGDRTLSRNSSRLRDCEKRTI